jgi:EthD domain
MIKLVFLMRRRADVSVEAFQTHWLGNHARLVSSFASELQIRRYVQSHTIAPEYLGAFRPEWDEGDGWDGIAEVWLESLQVLAESRGTPDMDAIQDLLLADEASFVDLERSTLLITEEHVIIGDQQ